MWFKVLKFKYKYDLFKPCTNDFKKVVELLGYVLVEYSHIKNSKENKNLINSLGLRAYANNLDSFTYSSESKKYVFVCKDLNESEQSILLAHELAHIFLCHLSKNNILGATVQNEYEANEFAHYLLSNAEITYNKENFLPKVVISLLFLVFTVFISVLSFQTAKYIFDINKENQANIDLNDIASENFNYDNYFAYQNLVGIVENQSDDDINIFSDPFESNEDITRTDINPSEYVEQEVQENTENSVGNKEDQMYYITNHGNKYHLENCYHIKNREVTCLSLQEAENNGKTPCSTCLGKKK